MIDNSSTIQSGEYKFHRDLVVDYFRSRNDSLQDVIGHAAEIVIDVVGSVSAESIRKLFEDTTTDFSRYLECDEPDPRRCKMLAIALHTYLVHSKRSLYSNENEFKNGLAAALEHNLSRIYDVSEYFSGYLHPFVTAFELRGAPSEPNRQEASVTGTE